MFFKTNQLVPGQSGTSLTRASSLLCFTTTIGRDLFVHLCELPGLSLERAVSILVKP